MIEISTVIRPQSVLLRYAQAYLVDGKNRITIEDASTLRVHQHGGKLAPLVIEGYYPMTDRADFRNLENFLTSSYEPFTPFLYRMEQFVIRQAFGSSLPEDNVGGIGREKGLNGAVRDTTGNMPYRGTIEEFRYNMKVDDASHMLIGYFIKFKVYPFSSTEHRIKQVYWVK